jgi:ribonucleoside-diphosphate reductase beta chain
MTYIIDAAKKGNSIAMTTEYFVEQASLAELQRTPVEHVLTLIDQGLVQVPSYHDLYERWERQQWQVQELDFAADRAQWETFSAQRRKALLYPLCAFFQGEASVTDTLGPFLAALPTEEMRLFLTTQLVDEARHTMFFARFFRDALALQAETMEETLLSLRSYVNPHLQTILLDTLPGIADRLRHEPENRTLLAEGVTIYHIITEGMMALAVQRRLLEQYRQLDLFPAFRAGFTAVTRDESRHVVFGVKCLRDLMQQDATVRATIQATIERLAPTALAAITPVPEMFEQMIARGEDPWIAPRYGLESLCKKLKVLGIQMDLPTIAAAR